MPGSSRDWEGRRSPAEQPEGGAYLLKQWAAVSTQQLLRSVAPQSSLPSPWDDFSRSDACHGQPPLRQKQGAQHRPREAKGQGKARGKTTAGRAGGGGPEHQGVPGVRAPPTLRMIPHSPDRRLCASHLSPTFQKQAESSPRVTTGGVMSLLPPPSLRSAGILTERIT